MGLFGIVRVNLYHNHEYWQIMVLFL